MSQGHSDDGIRLALLERRVQEMYDLLHGGGGIEWKRSIRGQLHEMRDFVQASENLKIAAQDMRRAQKGRFSLWTQITVALAAVLTAASPYVLFALSH